jgi:radical SAM protein with 4Fe4S-binding SPASM domain
VNCPEIPNVTYADFSRRVFDLAGATRVPISMELEFTHRCNVRCVHCYVPDMHRAAPDARPELTADEVRRILDEAADMGVLWLLITGGEPLLRQDFAELYRHAKQRGFLITLFTNATMVTESIADLLAEYPPFAVEVTVHSMDAGVFESITQSRGSFDRCMTGLRRLAERSISIRIKSVAMRQNADCLSGVEAFAIGIGATYRFDPHISACLDGGVGPLKVRLSPAEIVALDVSDPKRLPAWVELVERASLPSRDRIFACGAGTRSFHVDARGLMSACLMTQYMTHDLRSGTLREGWSEFIPSVTGRLAGPGYACGGCERMVLCGRCPGWAYTEEGDEQAVVDYLCELGERRARAIAEYTSSEIRQSATC